MKSNPVNRLLAAAAAALVGVILLFQGGATSSAPAQPRAPYRGRPVAETAVRTHHARYARRAGYPHVRYVHPVYSRVNVNVVVHPVYPAVGPVYPTAGGWYGSYPYPYPYVTYANGYYPYVYYPYYTDLTARGYTDGLHRGQDDAEDGRVYDPYRKGFKNPGSVTYNNGFLNGYAVGYGH